MQKQRVDLVTRGVRAGSVALALVVTTFLLAGCVEADTPPTFSETQLGVVTASTTLTAGDYSPQYLDEYGLFYSTNYSDIVAINGVSYTTNANDGGFIVRPGVMRTSVLTPARYVSAKEQGPLSVTVSGLQPATTYYFRFYTIGRDNDDMQWLYGLTVGSYTTAATPSAPNKVSLGTPVAPKTMRVRKSYNVYGSLKPRHTSGTKPVRIYKYKHVKSKGKWIWKSYGYTTAKAYNYSSYSRYKASIKLTSKGSWRVRAYAPADSKHAAMWSAKYDYVKVK